MPRRKSRSRRPQKVPPTHWGQVALLGFFAAVIHLGPIAAAMWSGGLEVASAASDPVGVPGFAVQPTRIGAPGTEPEQASIDG